MLHLHPLAYIKEYRSLKNNTKKDEISQSVLERRN